MASVEKLWIRPQKGAAPEAVAHVEAVAGTALRGDHATDELRQITMIDAAAWRAACEELGVDVDPIARRANVLIDGSIGGFRLADTIGRTLRLGDVRIAVRGETVPCSVMDQAQAGLTKALVPDCRGGVFGQILNDGVVALGASVELDENAQ